MPNRITTRINLASLPVFYTLASTYAGLNLPENRLLHAIVCISFMGIFLAIIMAYQFQLKEFSGEAEGTAGVALFTITGPLWMLQGFSMQQQFIPIPGAEKLLNLLFLASLLCTLSLTRKVYLHPLPQRNKGGA
jgi:hypothetical protein